MIYSHILIKKQLQFHQNIMARITVEDCIKQVRNQYDLVILAKERTVQLGRGAAPAVDPEDDKKPVIALREIGESKILSGELEESIISKLRQIPDYQEEEELEEVDNDTFRQLYQGGLSKSEMEKSATRKFTARVPKIEPKPLKEIEEINAETEIVITDSADDNLQTQSTNQETLEESNPVEEHLEETKENDDLNETDSIEESNLVEESLEISSSEDLPTQENTIKEE